MNNLRATIEIIFKNVDPNKLMKKYKLLKPETGKSRELFSSIYSHKYPTYHNNDEIDNLYDILETKWKSLEYVKHNTIFNILVNFTNKILLEEKGEPVCKYSLLMDWRELSFQLGEDLLICAYFAYSDYIESFERTIFSWKPVISTNNYKLKELLKKGTAENHFHLKGSSPHFQLSWISLMNNILGRDLDFKKIENELPLNPETNHSFKTSSSELKVLIKKASFIRAYLFKGLILGEKLSLKELKISKILESKENNEINIFLNEFQREINFLKYEYGKKLGDKIPDYAIPKNISNNNYNHKHKNYNGKILLYGERFFLYSILKKIYSGEEKAMNYKDFFHAYLVIKEKFRDEFIQVNRRVGFGNFANYQNRKSFFLDGIYKEAVINMAINTSLNDQKIKSLEARIAPSYIEKAIKESEKDVYNKCFYDLDNLEHESVLNKLEKKSKKKDKKIKHFYVAHFIKKQEKYKDNFKKNYIDTVHPLNYSVRKQVKAQAFDIIKMRKSSKKTKYKLYGIDAANFEIGCRPEVFSQVFRFLRDYKIKNEFENFGKKDVQKLGITYHVGEDFLCMIDGLRAIDEAVRFLDYRQGDRLGYALALGIDIKDYYKIKKYKIILPKQVYLDNVVWMLSKIMEFNIKTEQSIIAKLKDEYYRLYSEIYDELDKEDCSYQTYYRAWKLRGDNPTHYKTGENTKKGSLNFWQKCGIDYRKDELIEIRKNKKACRIYMKYHYDPKVRLIGLKSEEVKISYGFLELTEKLQKAMQKEIAKRNICVETNPSSNFVIGTFKRYDKHPLVNFYNLGLTYDPEKIKNCPQISVSINTDDQGVFATYLENEYALMALALEKQEDENGNPKYQPTLIYNWLDRIRQMGLEQSFKRRLEK